MSVIFYHQVIRNYTYTWRFIAYIDPGPPLKAIMKDIVCVCAPYTFLWFHLYVQRRWSHFLSSAVYMSHPLKADLWLTSGFSSREGFLCVKCFSEELFFFF